MEDIKELEPTEADLLQARIDSSGAPLTLVVSVNPLSGQYAALTNAATASQLQVLARVLGQEQQKLYERVYNAVIDTSQNGA